jgi:NAD(P)-dependent dehydrogenase (short-subunit alcohol dehydrogenase family)
VLIGKRMLVVGSAGNLGPRWIEAALNSNAAVVATGLDLFKDSKLMELSETYKNLDLVELDVMDSRLPSSLAEKIQEQGLDGLVINSGIDFPPGKGVVSIEDFSINDWMKVLNVNVAGTANIINLCIPFLNKGSSVVVVGSLYASLSPDPSNYSHLNDGRGFVKHPAYASSKAALGALCRQYATHLAARGIRINMISPGGVLGNQDPEFIQKFERKTPMGRMANMSEIVGFLPFLLSDYSSYLTGQEILVDGGYSIL